MVEKEMKEELVDRFEDYYELTSIIIDAIKDLDTRSPGNKTVIIGPTD